MKVWVEVRVLVSSFVGWMFWFFGSSDWGWGGCTTLVVGLGRDLTMVSAPKRSGCGYRKDKTQQITRMMLTPLLLNLSTPSPPPMVWRCVRAQHLAMCKMPLNAAMPGRPNLGEEFAILPSSSGEVVLPSTTAQHRSVVRRHHPLRPSTTPDFQTN